jgi:hypothetical protein
MRLPSKSILNRIGCIPERRLIGSSSFSHLIRELGRSPDLAPSPPRHAGPH